jgi:pantoate--beta-alanine ligase
LNQGRNDNNLQDFVLMTSTPKIVRNDQDLRSITRAWRAEGAKSAIVPTMGALHDGHLALVNEAFKRAEHVIVSIFVNPKQFGPTEDLERYPRNEAADRDLLAMADVDIIYAPSSLDMYPPNFVTTVSIAGPAKVGLEDRFRPHFLTGVTTVVAKLLISADCDFAMFGEKDYQQLKVVSQMVRDLNIATVIIPCTTVREADGLALSSRNAYLSTRDRQLAPQLNQILMKVAQKIAGGRRPRSVLATARRDLEAAGFRVDYLVVRNADTLEPVKTAREPQRVLAAAWLGKTRLIDNVAVP